MNTETEERFKDSLDMKLFGVPERERADAQEGKDIFK